MEGPLTRTSPWGIDALLFRAIPGIMRVVISIPRWNGGHQRRSFLLVGALMGMVLLLGVQAMALDFYTLCRSGTPEEVEKAVEAGARVNARDKDGMTPLMYASWLNENPTVLKLLLEVGAEVNAQDEEGWTPLIYAAGRKNPDFIEILLEAGADLHARERHGLTPRMHATMFNENPKVLQILLEAGG